MNIFLYRVIFSIALTFISFSVYCQSAYYDALELQNHIDRSGSVISKTETWKILSKYSTSANPTDTQLNTEFNGAPGKNPFINLAGGTHTGAIFSTSISSPLSSVGGINVTNLADGAAKFLVQRTKEELSITFFSKFKDKLNDVPGLKELFPKTKATLDAIDTEIYMYANYLNTMREAFDDDFKNILTNLEIYLKSVESGDVDHEVTKKIEYFQAALLLVNNVRLGVHPADAVAKLSIKEYKSDNTPLLKIQEASKLFSIFSTSLKSTQPDRYWISSDSLQLLMDPITFKIYLGLLYQQHGDTQVYGNEFKTYLDKIAEGQKTIQPYQTYLKELILEGEQITLSIQQLKKQKTIGDQINSYSDLFSSSTKIISDFDELALMDNSFVLDSNSKSVSDVINLSNDIYLDINEKKYNALVLDLVSLLSILIKDDFEGKNDLIKYGTFIANVAQADDSDQVQAAIEAIALPVGSASIKRKTEFNVALNAYVGLSPGYEYIGKTDKANFIFGVYTPIGIAFSKGKRKIDSKGCYDEKGSNTLFLSLVDITAFSTFRFGDDETANLPEVTLENIFAPGLYYVRGLPNLPVSIGLGGQIGPQLRSITADDTTTNDGITVSAKLFVAIDIPLINFYTKSR